uniref:Uncharacterized protein n=1 Tax=Electrophorus electricus TaxID=8005 RepID=A0AAY5EVB7_ELEEL
HTALVVCFTERKRLVLSLVGWVKNTSKRTVVGRKEYYIKEVSYIAPISSCSFILITVHNCLWLYFNWPFYSNSKAI